MIMRPPQHGAGTQQLGRLVNRWGDIIPEELAEGRGSNPSGYPQIRLSATKPIDNSLGGFFLNKCHCVRSASCSARVAI